MAHSYTRNQLTGSNGLVEGLDYLTTQGNTSAPLFDRHKELIASMVDGGMAEIERCRKRFIERKIKDTCGIEIRDKGLMCCDEATRSLREKVCKSMGFIVLPASESSYYWLYDNSSRIHESDDSFETEEKAWKDCAQINHISLYS
jgi:hypothetical protein